MRELGDGVEDVYGCSSTYIYALAHLPASPPSPTFEVRAELASRRPQDRGAEDGDGRMGMQANTINRDRQTSRRTLLTTTCRECIHRWLDRTRGSRRCSATRSRRCKSYERGNQGTEPSRRRSVRCRGGGEQCTITVELHSPAKAWAAKAGEEQRVH